jgi:23S rRNA pseudouridine2604 synthase
MCQHFGYKVRKLKRVRILNITLDGLSYGKWRFLTQAEVSSLKTKTDI